MSATEQRPEREALEPRDDRGADLGRVRGAEDEEHSVGRLFEGLEEDVPALLDALDLVDDEDLALQVRRGRVDARQQLAHVVDAVVGGRVQLDHVEGTALADRHAVDAGVVRLAVDQVEAVDGLGEDARGRGLACAARPDEEEAVAEPVEPDGVAQRLHDRPLADDLAERLGPETAVDGLVLGRIGEGLGHGWSVRRRGFAAVAGARSGGRR